MKYQSLKKFLRTQDVIGSESVGGVPFYRTLDYDIVLCMFGEANFDNRKYLIKTQDNSAEWRAKRDKLTSEAEYDIIRIR